MIQHVWNLIGPGVGWILGHFINHVFKVRRIKLMRLKADPVTEAVRKDVLVEFRLAEILREYDADRVYLIQFHNGGNFYPTGKSIPKFSVFYEKMKPGICGVSDKFQNIPVSIFSKFFNYLSENLFTCFPDIRKASDDDVDVKGLTHDTDSRSSYIVAIKTIDDKFMGVLCIDYIRKRRFLQDDKMKDLRNHGSIIGGELVKHQDNK